MTEHDELPKPIADYVAPRKRGYNIAAHIAALAIIILAAINNAPVTGLLVSAAVILHLVNRWWVIGELTGFAAVIAALTEHWPLAPLVTAWALLPYVLGGLALWRNRHLNWPPR